LRRILIGLTLAALILIPVFTIKVAAKEVVSTNKNYDKISSVPTGVLRHNIRMILRDRRFDYPDHLKGLKRLWRRVLGWFAKMKSAKKAPVHWIWQRVLPWLGFAGLIAFIFLLVYSLPKMFAYSGKVKSIDETHPSAAASPLNLQFQAGILAEQGQYREAIRLLYLTGLDFLQKKRFLPERSLHLSDKANLQIIRNQFGSMHPGYGAFRELVLVFQEKWYGLHNCQREDYYRLIENLKIMEATMGNSHG
jgi:hypothetical protein